MPILVIFYRILIQKHSLMPLSNTLPASNLREALLFAKSAIYRYKYFLALGTLFSQQPQMFKIRK